MHNQIIGTAGDELLNFIHRCIAGFFPQEFCKTGKVGITLLLLRLYKLPFMGKELLMGPGLFLFSHCLSSLVICTCGFLQRPHPRYSGCRISGWLIFARSSGAGRGKVIVCTSSTRGHSSRKLHTRQCFITKITAPPFTLSVKPSLF